MKIVKWKVPQFFSLRTAKLISGRSFNENVQLKHKKSLYFGGLVNVSNSLFCICILVYQMKQGEVNLIFK